MIIAFEVRGSVCVIKGNLSDGRSSDGKTDICKWLHRVIATGSKIRIAEISTGLVSSAVGSGDRTCAVV
jgi:hypothetical protein